MSERIPRGQPADVAVPPWLWIWAAITIVSLPAVAWSMVDLLTYITEAGSTTSFVGVTQLPGVPLLLSEFITTNAPQWLLYGGLILALVPPLRRWYVIRRYRLESTWRPSPAMDEIVAFIHARAPGVEIKRSLKGGPLAFVYPTGFQSAGVAIFRDLPILWRADRGAAEAALLHELGHIDHGDAMILGTGSPLEGFLSRALPWVLVLTLIPGLLIFLDGFLFSFWSTLHWGMAGTLTAVLIRLLMDPLLQTLEVAFVAWWVPIAAIWASELGSDRYAARLQGGPRYLERGLTSGARQGILAWLFGRLTHPPSGLRRWMIRHAATPIGTLALLLFYPILYSVYVLVQVGIRVYRLYVVDGYREVTESMGRVQLGIDMLSLKPQFAALAADLFIVAIVLALWPWIAPAWARVVGGQGAAMRGLDRKLHLAAAAICGVLAVASVAAVIVVP